MNLVVCQSPKYLTKSINKMNSNLECKLVIREVRGIYNFIKKNKLVSDKDLIFLPVYKRKSLFGLIRNFLAIKLFCYKYNEFFDDIYVFTNAHDFTTTSLVNAIKIKGKVYFEEFINIGEQSTGIVKLIDKSIFGVKSLYNDNLPVYLPINRTNFNITSWSDDIINDKCKVPLLGLSGSEQKKMLIIDSNDQSNKNLQDVQIIYKNLIELCRRNNIKLVIKGHPRLGLSKCLTNMKDVMYIDNEIPLEFLSLDNIDYITGFYSSSLCIPEVIERSKSLLILSGTKKECFYKNYLINNGFRKENFLLKIEDVIISQRASK